MENSMEEYYIGADMGSSSIKMILIDSSGRQIAESHEEYSISTPQSDWKEIDPEYWYDAFMRGTRRLLSGIDGAKVCRIGITGQMHTTVFLDENGHSVRPAIMWNDGRTGSETADLRKFVADTKDLSYLERVISNGCAACSLLWLKRNEAESFARIRHFVIGPGYLVYRLTGQYTTDACESSTSGLYDLKNGCWSAELADALALPLSACPPVYGSAQIVGPILPRIAEALGLSTNVHVIAGTGDNPAASISTGGLIGDYPVISIGTSGVMVFPMHEMNLSSRFKNVLFSLDGKETRAIIQGTVQTAGNCLSWLVRSVFHSTYQEACSIEFDRDFSSRLLFYPHFVGEKAVRFDPDARGAVFGLCTDTTREQLVLAVIEGVCFGFREILEAMDNPLENIPSMKVIGGGAKNPAWLQVLANVLNMPVEQLDSDVGAAHGVALIAAHANQLPVFDDFRDTMPKPGICFVPDRQYVEKYNSKYAHYKKMYDALKAVYE